MGLGSRLLSSLRARLALWYLLVLGAVLLAFGAGVFWEVRESLYQGVDDLLRARANVVAVQITAGPGGVRYQGHDAPAEEAETAAYLFDTHGRLRDRVAGSFELPPRPALAGVAGGVTVDELRYYMTPVRGGVIQVVTSLDTVNDQVDKLLVLLLLATPALLALATAGGVFLAGRAPAPIDRITRTARAIGADNLTGRLGLAPRHDEVGRLAATFDEMLDRLERAFAQQRQFAADASHELRTPLTIIKGDLDVLLRRRRSPQEYEEVVRDVDDEVTRLARLVEDLLTLARADSGQAELAREFVYLDALVADVVASMRRLAADGGLTVDLRMEHDVAVVGDPARLRQLVLNLLSNAVKNTPAGGSRCRSTRATDMRAWASPIRGSALRRRISPSSSTVSSGRTRPAPARRAARAWAWPSRAGARRRTAGASTCGAGWGKAACSACCCPVSSTTARARMGWMTSILAIQQGRRRSRRSATR